MHVVDRTGASDRDDFARLTDPYRRELLVHCYRMLGSVHDAEDLLQETLLRAWRGYDGFEGRSSLRTWLYRIATRACLTALENGNQRVLPSGLGAPGTEPDGSLAGRSDEVHWLEPISDRWLEPATADPAVVAQVKAGTRLAMIAAMQLLPARQRAVLILRDVLRWRAKEVADLLDMTPGAVHSSLLRARAQVALLAPAQDEVGEPEVPGRRALLDRYVTAFHDADVAELVRLLHEDVVLEMPPIPTWFRGQDEVSRFLSAHCVTPDSWRMQPVAANGQPAAAAYLRDEHGVRRGQGIHVLTTAGDKITRISVFLGLDQLAAFGLPLTVPDVESPDGRHTPTATT